MGDSIIPVVKIMKLEHLEDINLGVVFINFNQLVLINFSPWVILYFPLGKN